MPAMLRMSAKIRKIAAKILGQYKFVQSEKWKRADKRLNFQETDRIK